MFPILPVPIVRVFLRSLLKRRMHGVMRGRKEVAAYGKTESRLRVEMFSLLETADTQGRR